MDESRDPSLDPTATPGGALPDEPLTGTSGSTGDAWGEGAKAEPIQGREWLAQLQKMIDDIATQAAPVARQVAAKAAELAAVGAEKAGPFATRAAEVTTDVGQKVAERANALAKDLRREADAEAEATGTSTDASATGTSSIDSSILGTTSSFGSTTTDGDQPTTPSA